MYNVVIINDEKEMYLNITSTDINSPRIKGTIKQGINSIDSFTITMNCKNEGFFNIIKPKLSRVKVINTLTKKIEFVGRILKEVKSMSTNGLLQKQYVCESALGYLRDSVQEYGEYHNISVQGFLQTLIDNHNSQVEKFKNIKLRNVNVIDSNDSLYRYTAYKNTWENIKEDLLNKLGGELQIVEINGELYLDYLSEIGKKSETVIELAKNLKSIESERDISNFPSRIIPLGAKIKGLDTSGNEVDTEYRLTIESVNNGKTYIDFEDAINEFGINTEYILFDDINEASSLLTKGKEYINSLRLNISNKLSALDLSLLGLDADSFEVGNYHLIRNGLLDIDYELRIIEKSISIENPQNIELVFGEKKFSIKESQLEYKKLNDKFIELKTNFDTKISQTENQIKNVENEITDFDNKIEVVQSDMSSYVKSTTYNSFVINVNTQISNINSQLSEIEQRLNILEEGSGTIGE